MLKAFFSRPNEAFTKKVIEKLPFAPSSAQLSVLEAIVLNFYQKSRLSKLFFSKKGLYLVGRPGTGKTSLINAFLDTLTVRNGLIHRYHIQNLLIALNNSEVRLGIRARNFKQKLGICKSSIIFIDEFYLDHIADATLIQKLLKELIKAKCYIVFTSNTPIKGLYKDGFNRENIKSLLNLLATFFDEISLEEVDWRYKTADLTQLLQATPKIEGSFPEGKCLTFYGRRYVGVFHKHKLLKIDFQICFESPVGKKDFVSWFEDVRVVHVYNLPHLSALSADVAKRWQTFIDQLYLKKNIDVYLYAINRAKFFSDLSHRKKLNLRTDSRLWQLLR